MKTATPAERAFWDSSGIVLLCANQRSTSAARRIRAQTGSMATWWGTPVEVQSALQLAAALVLCHEHPRNRAFVCFDAKLASAADAAGFMVLPAR